MGTKLCPVRNKGKKRNLQFASVLRTPRNFSFYQRGTCETKVRRAKQGLKYFRFKQQDC